MNLTLIRHMPTPDNAAGILQGRRDTPILPPGPEDRLQIERNRSILAPFSRYDRILVSTLQRTRQTAALYTDRFSREPLTDELDFGPFEGRLRKELLREHPEWETDPSSLVLGESLADLEGRVRAFLEKYRASGSILVFGHGAWIRALTAILETGSLAVMNHKPVAHNTIIRTSLQRRSL